VRYNAAFQPQNHLSASSSAQQPLLLLQAPSFFPCRARFGMQPRAARAARCAAARAQTLPALKDGTFASRASRGR
jgi:hypothetical protein